MAVRIQRGGSSGLVIPLMLDGTLSEHMFIIPMAVGRINRPEWAGLAWRNTGAQILGVAPTGTQGTASVRRGRDRSKSLPC